MINIRLLQLPSQKFSDRDLKKIQDGIESGDLEVDPAFQSLVNEMLTSEDREQSRGEFVIRASQYFGPNYSTLVAIGVSFTPKQNDSSNTVAKSLKTKILNVGLDSIVQVIYVNSLEVDIAS